MKKTNLLVLVLALGLTGIMLISLPGVVFAAESQTTEAFTFVQVCDPQLGWGYGYDNDVNSLKQAVSHINGLKPDLVVFCGDLVDNFNDNSVADFLQIKSGLTVPSYCAPGNHDVGNSPTVSRLERYRQAIGDDYFSFEHKGYTFVIVNAPLRKAPLAVESEKQDAWLKQTLAAARDKNSPVFIVGHHPLYLKDPNEAQEYYNLPPAKRSELLTLFEDSGVVAVLGGHRHQLVINEYKGIQLVNGEATSRNTDGRPLGFRLWHVDSPTSIRHEFRPLVPEIPTADFNGDEVIDCADMCIMVDHWGEDYALCDIAPPPFGDGIIDVQDLILLSEHLFEDYRLTAHWKLDETDGTIAYDSISLNDGIVHGNPTWQPEGGMLAGAIEFDGMDDYVSTPFALDPADGPYSVFAWVKGGAAGQVVISQTEGGENWLLADPEEGKLITELKPPGRLGSLLKSQTVITDGQWHCVGLTWDGSYRALYVDDCEVAKDVNPQSHLRIVVGGLYIGAGKTLDAGSFFSGLIDDVRIYNRALSLTESCDTSREVHVDADDADSQVELEQGQILVITLESNPTTGYRWEQVETQESILQQMGEAEFKPSQTGEPPIIGAGGWEIFRFKAISAGQMTLQLVYRRPWEEGVEPVKTFSLQVVVR